jgi:hypothetical protein
MISNSSESATWKLEVFHAARPHSGAYHRQSAVPRLKQTSPPLKFTPIAGHSELLTSRTRVFANLIDMRLYSHCGWNIRTADFVTASGPTCTDTVPVMVNEFAFDVLSFCRSIPFSPFLNPIRTRCLRETISLAWRCCCFPC